MGMVKLTAAPTIGEVPQAIYVCSLDHLSATQDGADKIIPVN
jgi:hypothetical protein